MRDRLIHRRLTGHGSLVKPRWGRYPHPTVDAENRQPFPAMVGRHLHAVKVFWIASNRQKADIRHFYDHYCLQSQNCYTIYT